MEVASIAFVWSPAKPPPAFRKQVVVVDGLKEVLKELKSIGRNLNQLVTLAHMGRITVINLDSVRQAFSELCAAVRLILERRRW